MNSAACVRNAEAMHELFKGCGSWQCILGRQVGAHTQTACSCRDKIRAALDEAYDDGFGDGMTHEQSR